VRGLTDDALARGVHAVLDRRLAPASAAPVALALSGGGDSTALALIAADWVRTHGRRLLILTVDHRLSPASGAWTQACAALAARLRADFLALAWEGEKPAAGLPAAARAARHALLAQAARAAGARALLMAHTASDIDEAAAMRAAGSTTPSPREWTASPAWPEGRAVFLLRPMLHLSRGAIREWLAARSETWIEDPANADLRFARARARAAGPAPAQSVAEAKLAPLELTTDLAGTLRLHRSSLTPHLAALASLCAAGTSRPPRTDRLERIAALLAGEASCVATLAGARLEAGARDVLFLREPGELVRRPPPPMVLLAGETGVWDGRFEISGPGRIVALAGHAARLPPRQRAALRDLPTKARAALPFDLETLSSPALTGQAVSLVQGRLLAAFGSIDREPA
jgi:tRNA(Ile)-lysidine synthase